MCEAKLWRPQKIFTIQENVQIAEAQAWWQGKFDLPDTMIGVFDAGGTAVCLNDDAFNSDDFEGLGSLCRVGIETAGDYYVGVTGWSSVPFDGTHTEAGDYVVTVTVIPEPGRLLQLVSGMAGLLGLNRMRVRKTRAAARSSAARC